MNHHYPDSYHGYGRNAGGMQGMGYGGSYGDPTSMGRMGHPRESYQMSPYPMMQQPGTMYGHGGYVGQQQGSNPYNMGNYGNYGMPGMNPAVMMNNRQNDMNRMSGGNMVSSYYGPNMATEPHPSAQPGGMNSHPSSYSHGQPTSHMQQGHINMMPVQSQQTVPGQAAMSSVSGQSKGPPAMSRQPMIGQGGQLNHSSTHHMPQANPHQNSGAYGGQNSPLMMPRTHHVPQHPMRHPTTQQNPQEVADNILQMASAYPSNQTVQVPLKSRPAPYHIPRSPHYSVAHSDLPHTSPNPHQQQQSPVASCQASPSPSSSVKSPTPVLAPIPNPIPSPGISGLKSPCNQGMSPCGTQRSPAHMGSTYSGHSQGGPPSQCGSEGLQIHHGMSPSDPQHYSPCSMTPTHNFSPYNASPSAQRSTTMYSPCHDHSLGSNSEHMRQPNYSSPTSSSPCANNFPSYASTSKHSKGQATNSHTSYSMSHNTSSNPLMSLQKLVMLPETQVVDPKSVVNDACLSAQQNEGSKNVDDPAEQLAEGSSHSVGCHGQFSSLRSHAESSHTFQYSENHLNMADTKPAASTCTATPYLCSPEPSILDQNCGASNKVDDMSILCDSGTEYKCKKELSECEQTVKAIKKSERDSASLQSKEAYSDGLVGSLEKTKPSSCETFVSGHSLDTKSNTNDKPSLCSNENPSRGENVNPVEQQYQPIVIDTLGNLKVSENNGNDKISEIDGQRALTSPERKNGKVKEDTKCLMAQCRSPSVLSEVPVVTNGLTGTSCSNDDDLEQDCGNGVHTKIQNAFSSLVRAKFARAKRASQFSCVTPCSIAVGADERAACERFAFRRNGFCRTLRTSRVILNGRNRNDSTGNGDSDESLENVSERCFELTESPQDGNRKRTSSAAKRKDHKKPNFNSVSTPNKMVESDSKPTEPMTSGSNGCVSYNHDTVSDDDVCYYEGVDSSDIFINNCSSDESIASSGEAKQSSPLKVGPETCSDSHKSDISSTPVDDNSERVKSDDPDKTECKQETKVENTSDDKNSVSLPPATALKNFSPSPPAKRLRRSSGQKAQEKLKALSVTKRISNSSLSEKAETVIDLTSDPVQWISSSASPSHAKTTISVAQETIKELPKRSNKFRPLILGHSSPGKYPVVVLEKSKLSIGSSVKQEVVDRQAGKTEFAKAAIDNTNQDRCLSASVNERGEVCGKTDIEQRVKVESTESIIKTEESHSVTVYPPKTTETAAAPLSKKSKPKQRPHRRKTVKSKGKVAEKINRNAEVKDSFKSMKFSRTLDLMKSRRRREATSTGPFIRVTGKQSAPDSVCVFNQPTSEQPGLMARGKHKHSKNKKSYPILATTTIHMVTNLPTDKTAVIPSTRTISQNPWACAFCAHHSSYRCLGDLFGPYFTESEIARVESIALEENKKGDCNKDQKPADSGTSSRKAKESTNQEKRSSRKGKSPQAKPAEASPAPPEEVWVHEACAMWSPGVYLVGNKMYGLDEAVKDAAETVCSVCKSKGAMIGCLHKGCSMKYHYSCAVDKDCYMDEENLSLLCPRHKDKRLSSAGPARS